VIVVGSVNADLVLRVARLPGRGETVTGGTFVSTLGGKGANTAAAAAKLGAGVWLVGMVGRDDFGRDALDQLKKGGVDVSYVGSAPGRTGVAVVLVGDDGENSIAVAAGANAELAPDFVVASLRDIIGQDTVVVANLEVPHACVLAAAQVCRELAATFVMNPSPAGPLSLALLKNCDVLVANEHEIGNLGYQTAADMLRHVVRAVIVTRGKDGAVLFEATRPPSHQAAFPVRVIDTTGAGDAFAATLAWAISERYDLRSAVRYAAAAGALATRAIGAQGSLATRRELEEMFASDSASARAAP